MAVYAKKYDPVKSFVDLSPVRLVAHLHFPADNSNFDLDLELKGVVGGCLHMRYVGHQAGDQDEEGRDRKLGQAGYS